MYDLIYFLGHLVGLIVTEATSVRKQWWCEYRLRLSSLYCHNPNSIWLVTSRLDTTRHFRRVEPMHFGCVELVEHHGSTRSSGRAQHVERVVSCRDVTSLFILGVYRGNIPPKVLHFPQNPNHSLYLGLKLFRCELLFLLIHVLTVCTKTTLSYSNYV